MSHVGDLQTCCSSSKMRADHHPSEQPQQRACSSTVRHLVAPFDISSPRVQVSFSESFIFFILKCKAISPSPPNLSMLLERARRREDNKIWFHVKNDCYPSCVLKIFKNKTKQPWMCLKCSFRTGNKRMFFSFQ